MSSPYVGEIRMFGGNFAPVGWAFCDGSAQSVGQNYTLFTLIGNIYGGDGQETYNLPNLLGRVPIHQGQGPGLSQNYTLAAQGGATDVTLSPQQMPQHNHPFKVSDQSGQQPQPTNAFLAAVNPGCIYSTPMDTAAGLQPSSVAPVGGSQSHTNMAPSLTVNFIIALDGIFPAQ